MVLSFELFSSMEIVMANAMDKVLRQALTDGENSQKDLFLTFHLGGEDYGIAIGNVIEIVGIQAITEVPDLPDYLKGVVNMRGVVIPVMDVRLRFSMPERPYDERTCLIIIKIDEDTVGLVVDRVNEVAEIPVEQIEPAPRVRAGQVAYVMGMGKVGNTVKMLLDAKELLGSIVLPNSELALEAE